MPSSGEEKGGTNSKGELHWTAATPTSDRETGVGQGAGPISPARAGRKLLYGGGGGDTEAHFPNPPPLLGRRDGRGGFRAGVPELPCRGGGGGDPTSMAQNDTHVALIILTTQMWGGGGGIIGGKNFSGQNLCSRAFGANIRSYTKQRARHGTPFLQSPPPPSAGVHVTPPPPPPRRAIFRSPSPLENPQSKMKVKYQVLKKRGTDLLS